MLRLITLTLGGEGYLTFMGNEFGHPEWIDFPREGNGWSYHYCRRQWSLAENGFLRYSFLRDFDKDMLSITKKYKVLENRDQQLSLDNSTKTVVYKKGGAVFAFNFHPTNSYDGFWVTVPKKGDYTVVMSSDDHCYGGFGRVAHQTYTAQKRENGTWGIRLYLPARTAVVLR